MIAERKKVEQRIEQLASQLSESLIRCQPKITDEQLNGIGSIMKGFIECAYTLGAAEMKEKLLSVMEMGEK